MRKGPGDSTGPVVRNRRARHDYHIEDRLEVGLVLEGNEVKSIREGGVSLADAHARPEDGELWLHGMHVAPYQAGNLHVQTNPRRPRKLLAHRQEIRRLTQKVQERGYALVPLALYFVHGRAKIELALAKGRKVYDKRRALAERDAQRDLERTLSERREP